MDTPERVAARIKELDVDIPILETQLTSMKKERDAAYNFLPFAKNIDTRATPTTPPPKKYTRPRSPDSQRARAITYLRANPEGLTVHELIAMSKRDGKEFKMSSITSILSQLVKDKTLRREGDRYVFPMT